MTPLRLGLLLLLLLSAFSNTAFGYTLTDDSTVQLIKGSNIFYYLDEHRSIKTDQLNDLILTSDSSRGFPNLGFTNSSVWVKIPVTNQTNTDDLIINYTVSYATTIYYYGNSLNQPPLIAGVNYSDKKTVKDLGYYFDLNIQPGDSRDVWFRIEADQQVILAFELGSREAMLGDTLAYRNVLYGIFLGIMMVMILYNLVIYLFTRIKLYILYVVYITFQFLGQSALIGIYQTYFPIFGVSNNYFVMYFSVVLLALAGNVFVFRFIDIPNNLPRFKWAFYGVNCSYVLTGLFIILGYYRISTFLLQINALYCAFMILACALYIGFIKNNYSAKILFVAWMFLLLGNMIYVLKDFGILPYNWFTNNILATGTAVETVLISLALADLINRMRKANAVSKTRVIAEEQRNSQLQLQLTRSELATLQGQMNPHFVFNALSSIQNDILKEELDDAYNNLGKFANLMRNGLIHSRSHRITLKQEIDFLTNYFELEKKRFSDQFNFSLTVSTELLVNHVLIPPLLIQPLCENAIKHAFAGRTDGSITVHFGIARTDQLHCTIEDDGVGINSRPNSNLDHKSAKKNYGLTIVKDRIRLLNEQGKKSSYEVVDLSTKDSAKTGTKISLLLPLEYQK